MKPLQSHLGLCPQDKWKNVPRRAIWWSITTIRLHFAGADNLCQWVLAWERRNSDSMNGALFSKGKHIEFSGGRLQFEVLRGTLHPDKAARGFYRRWTIASQEKRQSVHRCLYQSWPDHRISDIHESMSQELNTIHTTMREGMREKSSTEINIPDGESKML